MIQPNVLGKSFSNDAIEMGKESKRIEGVTQKRQNDIQTDDEQNEFLKVAKRLILRESQIEV